MIQIMKEGPDLKLVMVAEPGSGYEGDMYGFDLMRRAIINLIEDMDTHLAEKEVDPNFPHFFYASILSAIARHYMMDDPIDREITVQQALQEIIDWLAAADMLQETINGEDE